MENIRDILVSVVIGLVANVLSTYFFVRGFIGLTEVISILIGSVIVIIIIILQYKNQTIVAEINIIKSEIQVVQSKLQEVISSIDAKLKIDHRLNKLELKVFKNGSKK